MKQPCALCKQPREPYSWDRAHGVFTFTPDANSGVLVLVCAGCLRDLNCTLARLNRAFEKGPK